MNCRKSLCYDILKLLLADISTKKIVNHIIVLHEAERAHNITMKYFQDKTRGGFKFKIRGRINLFATLNGQEHWPLYGYITMPTSTCTDGVRIVPCCWTAIGRYSSDESEHPYDLMPIEESSTSPRWLGRLRNLCNRMLGIR
jgi:hypothetical protein